LRAGNSENSYGGSILASGVGGTNKNGGTLNMSSGDDGSGGDITTSNGGGSIDTRGTGSIGFGLYGTRTTLSGSATTDQTITMPNASGTMALVLVGSDTIDFPNIPGNSTATHDVGIVGVIAGEAVLVTCVNVRTGTDQKVVFTGFVAGTPDTVTVLATNTGAGPVDLPSLSFKIIVFRGL
jgi:hypothetical protein